MIANHVIADCQLPIADLKTCGFATSGFILGIVIRQLAIGND
jgi:hypothetical protein